MSHSCFTGHVNCSQEAGSEFRERVWWWVEISYVRFKKNCKIVIVTATQQSGWWTWVQSRSEGSMLVLFSTTHTSRSEYTRGQIPGNGCKDHSWELAPLCRLPIFVQKTSPRDQILHGAWDLSYDFEQKGHVHVLGLVYLEIMFFPSCELFENQVPATMSPKHYKVPSCVPFCVWNLLISSGYESRSSLWINGRVMCLHELLRELKDALSWWTHYLPRARQLYTPNRIRIRVLLMLLGHVGSRPCNNASFTSSFNHLNASKKKKSFFKIPSYREETAMRLS